MAWDLWFDGMGKEGKETKKNKEPWLDSECCYDNGCKSFWRTRLKRIRSHTLCSYLSNRQEKVSHIDPKDASVIQITVYPKIIFVRSK